MFRYCVVMQTFYFAERHDNWGRRETNKHLRGKF